MVNSSEKRRLMEAYQDPIGARSAVAKAVVGLVIIVGMALVGVSEPVEDERTAQVSSEQDANGR
jgi:hypothetical protein